MSDASPAVFIDADTLLNLAQDGKALSAVVTALSDRAHVTTAVLRELGQSVAHAPPVPNAQRALSAALNMQEIDPSEFGPEVMNRMAQLRDRVAVPGQPSSQHLGEASSVACAEAMGGVVASDDRDARTLASITQVPVVTTGDLLTKMVQVQRLTKAEAEEAIERMQLAGRSIDQTRLRLQ